MSGLLKELLRKRHPKSVSEMPPQPHDVDNSPIIEPATGEKKTELERACAEYLENPDKTAVRDFLDFTSNMIGLIGRVRVEIKAGNVISYFSDIKDQETQTSMVFHAKETGNAEITAATITSRHPDTNILETLAIVSFPLHSKSYDECQWTMTSIDTPLTPSLPKSYITNREEKRSPIIGTRDLNSIEVKGFAQRVFEVYQRQGQQAQSPTSQN